MSGGLVPTGAPPPAAMDDVAYLRQMYANGAQDYFDALGAHLPGFANPPEADYQGGDYDSIRGFDDHRSFFFRNTLEAYRQVMVENGDGDTLIWPTEFGWPVWQGGDDERFAFAKENSWAEQSAYTVKAFEMGLKRAWVGPMFLRSLDYNVTAPDTGLSYWSILNTPTYNALVAAAGYLPAPATNSSDGNDKEIVMVLDLSGSMAAEDFAPNRLSAAKTVLRAFIDRRAGDRLGLITFAGDAIGQIQPTLDHTMLKGALDSTQLAWDSGLESGTAIGVGLQAAIEMFSDTPAKSKVIILLTDGANNAGDIEPLAATQAAAAEEIRVYTIGIAKQGPARLVFPDGRVEYRDFDIDEELLGKIAEETGGIYFSTNNADGLQAIYDQIHDLETGP